LSPGAGSDLFLGRGEPNTQVVVAFSKLVGEVRKRLQAVESGPAPAGVSWRRIQIKFSESRESFGDPVVRWVVLEEGFEILDSLGVGF
jgi:hypothetical protein